MASWILVPSLISLREEFNLLAPNRDRASDGSIGDTRHGAGSSDHNPDDTPGVATPSSDADGRPEVHAIDVDQDLRQPGWSMERAVQTTVLRHRGGQDDRLQNVIYNRRIWSRSWGWTARAYNGSNPHDHHAHFSARYAAAQEADTRSWGLYVPPEPAKEPTVAFADEKIKVTATTGVELYEPDLKPGTEVSAAILLQQAAIWARRGAMNTDTLEATVQTLAEGQAVFDRRLGNVEQWLVNLTTPASPEQTAALLQAVLGSRAAAVGRLLAATEA